jgi:aldose sugar dehydrogenase
MRTLRCTLVLALAVVSGGTPVASVSATSVAAERAGRAEGAKVPSLTIKTIASGLDHPWDITVLPGPGAKLFTQRDLGTVTYLDPRGNRRNVALHPAVHYHALETGMMSILPAHDYLKTHHFFTCHGHTTRNGHDVRVVMWQLASDFRSATKVRTIVSGLPSSTGRHGGCRLRFGKAALYVGTGDAAIGTNPQDLTSGGGKVLRVVPATGRPWANNPFVHSANATKRLVYTYGHRNVQGLALRPNGQMWSVEQGTYRDDEVNLIHPGGNYGYNPVPGYNESVPMTDHSLPGRQISAKWSSGDPTLATSGGIWLEGAQWGAWNDCLAVGVLKDMRLLILKFTANGTFVRSWAPAQLNGPYGRLRSPEIARDGSLLITTDNGNGTDRIMKVTPHG